MGVAALVGIGMMLIALAIREFADFAFYHSAVNYTTLGYGDIVMSPRWRLLGPQEAASGTLAFGRSTAVVVTVVIRLFRYRHLAQLRRSGRLRGLNPVPAGPGSRPCPRRQPVQVPAIQAPHGSSGVLAPKIGKCRITARASCISMSSIQ